jgi:hypothetical protein
MMIAQTITQRVLDLSWARWYISVIPATQENEAGEAREPSHFRAA